MRQTNAQAFTEALKVIREHPDWTDEKVAELLGVHAALIPAIVVPARRQVAADTPEPGRVTSAGQYRAEP